MRSVSAVAPSLMSAATRSPPTPIHSEGLLTDERSSDPVTRPPAPSTLLEPPDDAVATNVNDLMPDGSVHVFDRLHPFTNVTVHVKPDRATDTPVVDDTVCVHSPSASPLGAATVAALAVGVDASGTVRTSPPAINANRGRNTRANNGLGACRTVATPPIP